VTLTVFAYGATGAGKTFTMLGTAESPGVTFSAVMTLFSKIDESKSERVYDVSVSYLEVFSQVFYNVAVLYHEVFARIVPEVSHFLYQETQATTSTSLVFYTTSTNFSDSIVCASSVFQPVFQWKSLSFSIRKSSTDSVMSSSLENYDHVSEF